MVKQHMLDTSRALQEARRGSWHILVAVTGVVSHVDSQDGM